MPQQYNAQLIDELATDFPRRKEPNYAWGNALSGLLLTPRLRGQWGVSCDELWYLYDHSGQGRVLAPNGPPIPYQYGLTPYCNFSAGSACHYYRLDEPGLDLGLSTHGLSAWTWVNFNPYCTGLGIYIMGKWYDSGANERAFLFYKTNTNLLRCYISPDGIAATAYASAIAADYAASTWIFLAMRFEPSTSVDLWVGRANTGVLNKYSNTTTIPASVFNSPAPFAVGCQRSSVGATTGYFDGAMSLFGIADSPITDQSAFTMFHQTRPLFIH